MMVDFFVPIVNSKIDFDLFIQIATNNGYKHITKFLDVNGISIKHPLHFITLVEALGNQEVNPNVYLDSLLYHIQLGFFFQISFELTTKIASRTDLKIISFDVGRDKDIGIVTGTLHEWKLATIEALAELYRFDYVYGTLFSGILKSLDVLNYGKLFVDYERTEIKDQIIVLRKK